MEIRIAGYLAASHLLEREPGRWHAVVILGAETESTGYAETRALSCLYLRFDDVLDPRPGKITPTRDALRRGLDFATAKDKVLVTCRAGQGRSAALAYLIACQVRAPAEAITLLDATRHSPNRLVVKLGATALGDPTILDRFDEWRRDDSRIRLSDHYDEIEAEFDELERRGARNRITTPA
ncbi:hypothetical protein [Paludisphaera soli]|uniref:hypothetical protein n=1 Tax=Paludisphaera soli TaxID=2712865 RepID=UPI0013E9EA78|nr:hypothetical protein [Paludisphaera soli]